MGPSLFSAGPSPPLAERMRPRQLDELIGQPGLAGEDGLLRRLLAADHLPSLLLWGPPGSGKTSLARLLATESGGRLIELSAVAAGVADVRRAAEAAEQERAFGRRLLLFVDEIHRFHRGQQDALLPTVESGLVTLVGATTENPAHGVIPPLRSRCRLLRLEALGESPLIELMRRALEGGGARGVRPPVPLIEETLLAAIARDAGGDARRALSTLEIATDLARERGEAVSEADVRAAAQRRVLTDAGGSDAHYDLASALIKSLRGSDPDAAVYYLMRALDGGEDPRFLARRMIILAAEDVGLADPAALQIAVAAGEGFDRVGLPEGSLLLVEAALYLALAPKSDAVLRARQRVREAITRTGALPVPAALADASTAFDRSIGRGEGYRSPHVTPAGQRIRDHLPEALRGERFFEAEPSSGSEDDPPDSR